MSIVEDYLTKTNAPPEVMQAFRQMQTEARAADDLAHDLGVFTFCGLNFDKGDMESLRSDEGLALLAVLSLCRDQRAMDKYWLARLTEAGKGVTSFCSITQEQMPGHRKPLTRAELTMQHSVHVWWSNYSDQGIIPAIVTLAHTLGGYESSLVTIPDGDEGDGTR